MATMVEDVRRAVALTALLAIIGHSAATASEPETTLEGVCADTTDDTAGQAECVSIVTTVLGEDVRWPANLRRPVVEYVYAVGLLQVRLEEIDALSSDQGFVSATSAAHEEFLASLGAIEFPPEAREQAEALKAATGQLSAAMEGSGIAAPVSDELLALTAAKDEAALALSDALGIGVPVSEWADEYCEAVDAL
jgi:hypothetical protein